MRFKGPKQARWHRSLFWALKLLRLCNLRAQNRQDGAHVQKNTNGGAVYRYVPVQSEFQAAVSITWAIWRGYSWSPCLFWAQHRLGLQLNPLQIARLMDTAALKWLCTGTYKLHLPLIVEAALRYGRYRCTCLCTGTRLLSQDLGRHTDLHCRQILCVYEGGG